MSAPRSNFSKMMKRADSMSQKYQATIARQKHAIDRLVAANAVQGEALYAIEHEAKNVKDARKWAKSAVQRVKDILAVPQEEQ